MMVDTLEVWHRVARSGDSRGLYELLAEDAVFHSPVVHTPQQGRAIVHAYLMAAFSVLFNDSFEYVREVVGARDAVLEFTTEIDGIRLNGVDMIQCNDAGLITDFKVMVRPLKAVNLIHQKMGEMLAKQSGR